MLPLAKETLESFPGVGAEVTHGIDSRADSGCTGVAGGGEERSTGEQEGDLDLIEVRCRCQVGEGSFGGTPGGTSGEPGLAGSGVGKDDQTGTGIGDGVSQFITGNGIVVADSAGDTGADGGGRFDPEGAFEVRRGEAMALLVMPRVAADVLDKAGEVEGEILAQEQTQTPAFGVGGDRGYG